MGAPCCPAEGERGQELLHSSPAVTTAPPPPPHLPAKPQRPADSTAGDRGLAAVSETRFLKSLNEIMHAKHYTPLDSQKHSKK